MKNSVKFHVSINCKIFSHFHPRHRKCKFVWLVSLTRHYPTWVSQKRLSSTRDKLQTTRLSNWGHSGKPRLAFHLNFFLWIGRDKKRKEICFKLKKASDKRKKKKANLRRRQNSSGKCFSLQNTLCFGKLHHNEKEKCQEAIKNQVK